MKQTPGFEKAQANMRPGVISLEGFLGDDGRKLADILIEDAAAVRRMGLTHRRIAAAMQSFRDAGAKGLGLGIRVPPHFQVCVDGVRGVLPCPFEDGLTARKVNIAVTNESSGEELTFTDLAVHLIAGHGFYGGKGSRFRNEPADIARILEIEKRDD